MNHKEEWDLPLCQSQDVSEKPMASPERYVCLSGRHTRLGLDMVAYRNQSMRVNEFTQNVNKIWETTGI